MAIEKKKQRKATQVLAESGDKKAVEKQQHERREGARRARESARKQLGARGLIDLAKR